MLNPAIVARSISRETADHYTWGNQCDGWHLLRAAEVSVIEERMPPGASEVAHFHKNSRQFFFVLAGTLSILIDTVQHTLRPEHGIEIGPGLKHRVFNESESEVRFIVVSVPPSQGDRINVGAP